MTETAKTLPNPIESLGYVRDQRRPAPAAPAGRAIGRATPAYWFTMFAASALGTNLGDFWLDEMSLHRWVSFASLIAICSVAMLSGRAAGWVGWAGFWVAIVALRAAATNAGDYLTHDLGMSFGALALFLAAATLAAGLLTRTLAPLSTTPKIDVRYWLAMLIAGVFGTVAGDLASHLVGLFAAATLLGIVLAGTIAARTRLAPASVLGYWGVILVERCAGTPAGDMLASAHGVGLGLPWAIACTSALVAAGLATLAAQQRP